jgi:hypothetical protein
MKMWLTKEVKNTNFWVPPINAQVALINVPFPHFILASARFLFWDAVVANLVKPVLRTSLPWR